MILIDLMASGKALTSMEPELTTNSPNTNCKTHILLNYYLVLKGEFYRFITYFTREIKR